MITHLDSIELQEALQQLEANLEQQLQLICTTTRSPSLPIVTLTHASQEQIPNGSDNKATTSNQSAARNVKGNDDDWELVQVQMQ